MSPKLVFTILMGLGLIWTGFLAWVSIRSRQMLPYAELAPKVARLRKRLFYLFLAITAVGFLVSMLWLPYPSLRAITLGHPQVYIEVATSQWGWDISQKQAPKGVPVEFNVTSKDVNHSLALYSPSGQLLTQVQAMPGYSNRLIYTFNQPGTYALRCLEYCGIFHHAMVAELIVR